MSSGVDRISVSGSILAMTPPRHRTGAAPPRPTCGASARIAAPGDSASTTPSNASPALSATSPPTPAGAPPSVDLPESASRMRGRAMAACGANASGAHCAKSRSVNSACVLASSPPSSDASASSATASTCPARSDPGCAPARRARRTDASARGRDAGPAEDAASMASARASDATSRFWAPSAILSAILSDTLSATSFATTPGVGGAATSGGSSARSSWLPEDTAALPPRWAPCRLTAPYPETSAARLSSASAPYPAREAAPSTPPADGGTPRRSIERSSAAATTSPLVTL
mmetsp:Transcript_10547/g.47500  ORF Transcript_10547/g.47500 Transcript_10547/m.47500 type:complete len:290 (-) Transcript_10547:3580-4449(-)